MATPPAPGVARSALAALLAAALLAAGCAGVAPERGSTTNERVDTASTRAAPSPERASVAPEAASGWTRKSIAYAKRDMVVAAHPLAVDAGVRILAAGGSAVDAAIAVQMVLNLVEPQSSGIGGGAFMLHYDRANDRLAAYDGRETAPTDADPGMMLEPDGRARGFFAAVDGGLSVGTPGVLRMLELAHRRHGRLPWSALFVDAIALAEEGFPISPRLAAQIRAAARRIAAQGEPVASYFLGPDAAPKPAGARLANPEFAASLRAIAAGGADAFYTGALARAIVDTVRGHPGNPGRIGLQDLAGYRARERTPVCGGYRGFRICGMGPPSSGGIAVLQTLGMLERFELGAHAPDSTDALHLVAEAYRLAYADRARYVADPDFVDVPVAGMLDPAYLRARAGLIRTDRSAGAPSAGEPRGAHSARGVDASAPLPSTSHLSIVDRDGNVVSMTTTIEHGFGSLQMVGGFLLNNQLTDFSFRPADAQGRPIANRVEPGKRPRSSMAPTIVFDAQGRVEAVVGSPGGAVIIAYVTKTLIGLIDWGLDVQQAIDLPNFAALAGPTTLLERGTALAATRQPLEARGHAVELFDLDSGVHAIVFNGRRADGRAGRFARDPDAGTWAGGADPRREGVARGND